MAAISITAANVLASSKANVDGNYPAGATITQGEVVYLGPSNTWLAATPATPANLVASSEFGIALQSVSSGQPLLVVTKDPSFTYGANVASGSIALAHTTAGSVTITAADLSTGDAVLLLGVINGTTGTNNTTMNFRPILGGVL